MNLSSSCARAVARAVVTGALFGSLPVAAHAMVFVQGKTSAPVKVETPQKPVVLPDRSQTLIVDWVDTRNARLAIGGLTYGVRGAVPKIELVNGNLVNDIGYLKKGTQVRIQLQNDAQGVTHLTEVHVVASGLPPDDGGSGTAASGGNGTVPATSGSVVKPQ